MLPISKRCCLWVAMLAICSSSASSASNLANSRFFSSIARLEADNRSLIDERLEVLDESICCIGESKFSFSTSREAPSEELATEIALAGMAGTSPGGTIAPCVLPELADSISTESVAPLVPLEGGEKPVLKLGMVDTNVYKVYQDLQKL